MTKEDLIAMAREAGTPYVNRHAQGETHFGFNEESLARFAKLIEARTREECIEKCKAERHGEPYYSESDQAQDLGIDCCLTAIRAMGERT